MTKATGHHVDPGRQLLLRGSTTAAEHPGVDATQRGYQYLPPKEPPPKWPTADHKDPGRWPTETTTTKDTQRRPRLQGTRPFPCLRQRLTESQNWVSVVTDGSARLGSARLGSAWV